MCAFGDGEQNSGSLRLSSIGLVRCFPFMHRGKVSLGQVAEEKGKRIEKIYKPDSAEDLVRHGIPHPVFCLAQPPVSCVFRSLHTVGFARDEQLPH